MNDSNILPQNLKVQNTVNPIFLARWRQACIDFHVDGPYENEHDIYSFGDFMEDPRDPSRLYYMRVQDFGGGAWVYEQGSGWEKI